jgi:hypothetical protein
LEAVLDAGSRRDVDEHLRRGLVALGRAAVEQDSADHTSHEAEEERDKPTTKHLQKPYCIHLGNLSFRDPASDER